MSELHPIFEQAMAPFTKELRKKETPEHVWLWYDGYHTPQISLSKPPSHIKSVEYIRLQTDWNRL